MQAFDALEALETPAVLVDRAVLERNVIAMAGLAARLGVALRPHAKTHKCVALARRQLAAGAVGLSVATLGEAEVFAAAGLQDLFVAYPLWVDGQRARRLAALAERARLRVGVDSAEAAAALGRAVPGGRLEVLVEVDSGQHRSGVPVGGVAGVAGAAHRAGLVVVGAFTFPGHAYGPDMSQPAAADEARALLGAADQLRAGGHGTAVLSGGSTPTAARTEPGGASEIRPGVYVFNDAQQLALGTCRLEDVALSVLATVTSAPGDGRLVLDAGSKVLGADRPPFVDGHGIVVDLPGAAVTSLAEHHAVVQLPKGARPVQLGERLRVVPNHVCTTVNLVDELVVVEQDAIVEVWPVDARGRNS